MILVKSQRAGDRVMEGVATFLTHRLKLTVNETKSAVARTSRIDFLGFSFSGTRIIWSDKAYKEFRRRVRKLTGRSWFVSMEYRLTKLAEYLRGWMGYFGISEYYREIPEIDGWIRRRVRLCYWKQWRLCRTKNSGTAETGCPAWHIHSGRTESRRPVGYVPQACRPARYDQPMAEESRFAICQRTVGEDPLPGYGPVILSNRRMRTRLYGGVGAGGEKPPATRLAVQSQFHQCLLIPM